MTKLPSRLFVKLESPEPGDNHPMDYLMAHIDLARMVEMDETAEVGTYQLVETASVKGVFQVGDRQPYDKGGNKKPLRKRKRRARGKRR